MNVRETEDGCLVSDVELVWEVVWRYLNAEISEAEPEQRQMKDIPSFAKIWKHHSNIKRHCRALNKKVDPHLKRHEANGYHPELPLKIISE